MICLQRTPSKVKWVLLFLCCQISISCSPVFHPAALSGNDAGTGDRSLTPAQQYAGEILSYLIQVIMGQTGDRGSRSEWRSRGIDAPLDLAGIRAVMTDVVQSKSGLMVYDANILGLLDVLYYYDPQLRLYPEHFGPGNLYPAPELIAIRLLLMQKRHRGEQIRLQEMIEREPLLRNPQLSASASDLQAMNLSAEELRLLKDIVASRPHLFNYLKSPFLIEAVSRIGVVAKDDITEAAVPMATYNGIFCRHIGGSHNPHAVRIAFLPSMIKGFAYGDSTNGLSHYGFKSTRQYQEMIRSIADGITAAVKKQIAEALYDGASADGKWEDRWAGISRQHIAFYSEDERPLVIYPENADQVIQTICPDADIVVIIMEKNVYLSLNIDPRKDCYPHVNRFYLDTMDIQYSQYDDLADAAGRLIMDRVRSRLLIR